MPRKKSETTVPLTPVTETPVKPKTKRGRKKKDTGTSYTTIMLIGVDPSVIENKYNILGISASSRNETNPPPGTTLIDELVKSNNGVNRTTQLHTTLPVALNPTNSLNNSLHKSFMVRDSVKKEHRCTLNFINYHQNKDMTNALNGNGCVNYNCYWCRHVISPTVQPIGCPIKYIDHEAVKFKDRELIRQPVTDTIDNESVITLKNGFYCMDGVFCSFQCCLRYIIENARNPMYMDSEFLLSHIYWDMYGKVMSDVVEPAPDWRLLIEYGGHLTIEQFRNGFTTSSHQIVGIVDEYPVNPPFKSVYHIYMEKHKL